MTKWKGKVAVVTGANSGIGLAITKKLLNLGAIVVGMDKNVHLLQELAEKNCSDSENTNRLYPLNVDLCHDEEIIRAFQWVDLSLGGVDVLINNAGISGQNSILDGTPLEWRQIMDVNVIALCLCTKEAVSSMTKKNVQNGHIINMSSNVSHFVPNYAPFHFYSASKHAVQALTEAIRQELRSAGSSIRVTSICPGLVKTGIFKASLGENMNNVIYDKNPALNPEDVSSTIEFILNTPSHVQVHEINIKPVGSER